VLAKQLSFSRFRTHSTPLRSVHYAGSQSGRTHLAWRDHARCACRPLWTWALSSTTITSQRVRSAREAPGDLRSPGRKSRRRPEAGSCREPAPSSPLLGDATPEPGAVGGGTGPRRG
jgi:hypothetical protein